MSVLQSWPELAETDVELVADVADDTFPYSTCRRWDCGVQLIESVIHLLQEALDAATVPPRMVDLVTSLWEAARVAKDILIISDGMSADVAEVETLGGKGKSRLKRAKVRRGAAAGRARG